MAKKKSTKDNHIEKISFIEGFDGDLSRIIRVISITVIIFCAFYGLTLLLTRNGDSNYKKKESINESSISYAEILLGRSFTMPEEEYLVLYYDKSNSEIMASFSSIISEYRSKEEHYALYTVDMSNSFNSSYLSDVGNAFPSNISEMRIHDSTLIHFKAGTVSEYIEGEDNILNYFS